MSELIGRNETDVNVVKGVISSISNVSKKVLIDTKRWENVTCDVKSDYFEDSEDFIVISKGETFKFVISAEKESYPFANYTHFDGTVGFFKISIKENSGKYVTILNFDNEADYSELKSYVDISQEKDGDKYNITIEMCGYEILNYLNKDNAYIEDDIRIEIADKSGNLITCTNKIPIYCFSFDLDELKKLEITFEEQNPSQRYIGDGSIGSVVAIIHNPDNEGERPSADTLPIKAFLDGNSVGSIINYETTYFYYDKYGERVFVEDPEEIAKVKEETGYNVNKYEWLYVKIDNIVKTGYVELFAHLVLNNRDEHEVDYNALKYLEKRIYNLSLAFATDGEWLTECDNNKRINLEPFVPMYLKESQYFDFVKFTESFLNTMFYSNGMNCKVGILKKISDLRTLHDIDELDRIFFNDFAKHFGSTIKIDEENLVKILTIFGDKNKTEYTDDDLVKYIREAYRILPHYNKIKGTDESIKLILSTFGCASEIIYKWLSKVDGNNKVYENIEDKVDKDSYYLSSHFNVDLGIKNYKIEEFIEIVKPVKELVMSIKPITRVFDAFEYTLSTTESLTIDFTKSTLTFDDRVDGDGIFETYVDSKGDIKDEFYVNVKVNAYGTEGNNRLYEVQFLDNMTRIGLDNFEKFISNNDKVITFSGQNEPKKLIYDKISFVGGYMYLTSSITIDEGNYNIVCKCLKNSRTYINRES